MNYTNKKTCVNSCNLRSFVLFVLFAFSIFPAIAQQETIVIGQVLDTDRAPIENIAVYFKGTNIGTQTNDDGNFFLRTSGSETRIVLTHPGYKKQEIALKQGQSAGVEIIMHEEPNWLPEVFVLPGANPAVDLIKRVRAARKMNDLSRHPEYAVQSKEESVVFFSRNQQRTTNRRLWEHLSAGNLSSSDSSLLVPLYMSDRIFRITSAGKTALEENTFSSPEATERMLIQLTTQLSEGMNFYENSVPLFGKSLISPLANVAMSYYKYYLMDSVATETGKIYEVHFRNSNRKNPAFDGRLWVDSASLALTAIEAQLPAQANINFVNNLQIEQRFEQTPNRLWTKQSEQLSLNLTFETMIDSLPTKAHLLMQQSARFSPLEVDILPQETFAQSDYTQAQIDEKMQELRRDPLFRSAMWIDDAAFTGYAKAGKIDIGKIQQIVRTTDIEGFRLNIPLRTNEELWKNICLGGYVGYGFRNKEVKYSGYAQFRLPAEKRHLFGAGYTNDYRRTDYDYNDFMLRENPLSTGDEDFSNTILRFTSSPKMNKREEIWTSYNMDWNDDVESSVYFRSIKQFPQAQHLPFSYNGQNIGTLQQHSVTLNTRFSFNERVYNDHLQRIYLSNHRPVIHLTVEYGKFSTGFASGDYGKLSAAVKQNVRFDIGQWNYMVKADWLLGNVPYPLLVYPHGNESNDYHRYRFTMMKYMDFAVDRSIQLHSEWLFNGFLLNNIPLIKHLNLREVCSFKVAYGTLSNSHRDILDYPAFVNPLQDPYAEFGIGITNIFRVLAVQSVWSTTNLLTMENIRWTPTVYWSISF